METSVEIFSTRNKHPVYAGGGCVTIAALLVMTWHLVSIGADLSWDSLFLILFGVAVVGMLAALIGDREAICTPVIPTLRSE